MNRQDLFPFLIFSGLAVRLLVAPFFGHAWDVYIWVKSGQLTALDKINIYMVKDLTEYPWGFYAYPPLWLYWLSAAALIDTLFFNSLNIHVLLVKLPVIIADLLVAVLLLKIAKQLGYDNRTALYMSLLWFLNPVVMYISSVWGMFDSLAVLTTLLAFLYLLRDKPTHVGFFLGLGFAFKIYPALLTVPAVIYYLRERKLGVGYVTKKLVIPFVLVPLIVSLPYLMVSPVNFIGKMLYHISNMGQFTYWTGLATVVNPRILSVVSITMFLLLLGVVYRRVSRTYGKEAERLLLFCTTVLLAFLSTSSKVNVQYVLWVLPFIILCLPIFGKGKEFRYNFILLIVSAITFIASTAMIPGMYSLDNLGRINVITQQMQAGIVGALLVTSAFLGGTRFIALLTNLLKVSFKSLFTFNRIAIFSVIIIFSLFLSLFPTATGVSLPQDNVRVAVPEGVEALFGLREGFDISNFKELYNVTHVVIPVGPDVINQYPRLGENLDISRNSRFRLGIDTWKLSDVKNLTRQLRGEGYRVLLGIYVKAYYSSIYFGIHGYNATWLTQEHPELIDEDGMIYFQRRIAGGEYNGTIYADFFAKELMNLVEDIGFDGVYIMFIDWSKSQEAQESILQLLKSIDELKPLSDIEVFLEIDPVYVDARYVNVISGYVDYLVVETDPWVRNIRSRRIFGNFTVDFFYSKLVNVVENSGDAGVLFGVYVMDFVEGWFTPAVEIQSQVGVFSSVVGVEGYVIYHTNMYLPYKVSISRF